MTELSLFEELGGEPVLRAIVNRFVDRVFDDAMIGFFFAKANRERVKEKEYELAARVLGAEIEYTGRPIKSAHAQHPIMGGHFLRRLTLLRQTLEDSGVPERIQQVWLKHTESLRPLVTADPAGECNDARATERVKRAKSLPISDEK